jgi:hypothetical protein
LIIDTRNQDSPQTIGEALSAISKTPLKHQIPAILVLRCISVRNLLPEPNSVNQIIRSTVELCEGALPEIINFLRISPKAQNVDKFFSLSSFHSRILEILSPIKVPYGDLGALLTARKDIIGCLNHSIVKLYAAPFALKEVRSTIESIFGKLKRVSEAHPSLLTDIAECNQSIALAKEEAGAANTFLNGEHLIPFLQTCEKSVASFLDSLRGRFATSITLAGGIQSELQKRYSR